MPDNTEAIGWPFNPNTNIIDRNLARSIRTWALSGVMTEAELRSHSQRQLLRLYIERHIKPTIAKALAPTRTPEEAEAAAGRVLSESPPADEAERLLWEALHG
jgi:hypothetical protein